MVKITIVGDIMCEPRLLKSAKKAGEQYDFSGVFDHVRKLFDESDFVIGNLETPLAGKAAGYVHSLFKFNAPDSFAHAVKNAGIDMVLTANNHCLDRGLEGLKRTIDVLDREHLLHAGTFSNAEDRGNTYFQVGSIRFAVVAYTYGTNYSDNHILLSEDERKHVNLLRPQNEFYYVSRPVKKSLKQRIVGRIANLFKGDTRYYVRKWLGLKVNEAHPDNNLKLDTLQPYLAQLIHDIDEAKEKSDFVLFCPHVGGQFNKIPGEFSRFVFLTAIEHGADAIIASHAHIVQEATYSGKIPCFYSLGNYSMSPNSVYLLHDDLPEYGIAVHLYIDANGIQKATFSILRIEEKEMLHVFPVDEYYANCSGFQQQQVIEDVKQIFHTVCNAEIHDDIIRREYLLKMPSEI